MKSADLKAVSLAARYVSDLIAQMEGRGELSTVVEMYRSFSFNLYANLQKDIREAEEREEKEREADEDNF